MITNDERFVDIQGILAMSDIHPADCIKINDLIIELSKQNQELKQQNKKYKEVIDKLKKYIRLTVSEEEFIETEHYVELLDILKEVSE